MVETIIYSWCILLHVGPIWKCECNASFKLLGLYWEYYKLIVIYDDNWPVCDNLLGLLLNANYDLGWVGLVVGTTVI